MTTGQLTERLILVVDENPDHVRTIEQAFNETVGKYRLIAIAGHSALDFLHHRGDYTTAPRPDLILLDLHLPDKDGREILTDIKTTPSLRRIPIVILTLSDRADDIFSTYTLQGNCYVIKSSNLDQLYHLVKSIEDFWLGIVTLPAS